MSSPFRSRFSLRACGVSAAAGALLLAGGARSAYAGAFALSDQSPSAIATSFAGSAASASDPSTFFYNPAGMAYLPGVQTESVFTYLKPHAEFDNKGSQYSFGAPISGGDGGGGARGAAIGSSFLTARVLNSEKFGQLAIGIGSTVPFGLAVNYDPNWVGRYDSLRSALRTEDYGISLAYKWKFISIGAGFDAQYSSAVLTQAVDFGLIGFATPGLGAAAGFTPGNRDATLRLEGTDVSYGYNLGAIVEFMQPGFVPGLGLGKIGVSYRSGIKQELSGNVSFRNVPLPFAASPTFNGQEGSAVLKLPEVYHFSITQDFLKNFTLLGDVTWTRWGRLSSIPITFSNPATQATLVSDPALGRPGIATNYQDALRFTGGLEYRLLNDRLTLRIGGGYDETPIRNQASRSTRVPDGDRILVSTGLRYHVLDYNTPFIRARVAADIELAYLHEFVNDPDVDRVDTSGHRLRGSFDADVNVVSAAVIFRYGPRDGEPMPISSKEGKDHSK